jgi:hypothetical protein
VESDWTRRASLGMALLRLVRRFHHRPHAPTTSRSRPSRARSAPGALSQAGCPLRVDRAPRARAAGAFTTVHQRSRDAAGERSAMRQELGRWSGAPAPPHTARCSCHRRHDRGAVDEQLRLGPGRGRGTPFTVDRLDCADPGAVAAHSVRESHTGTSYTVSGRLRPARYRSAPHEKPGNDRDGGASDVR